MWRVANAMHGSARSGGKGWFFGLGSIGLSVDVVICAVRTVAGTDSSGEIRCMTCGECFRLLTSTRSTVNPAFLVAMD